MEALKENLSTAGRVVFIKRPDGGREYGEASGSERGVICAPPPTPGGDLAIVLTDLAIVLTAEGTAANEGAHLEDPQLIPV